MFPSPRPPHSSSSPSLYQGSDTLTVSEVIEYFASTLQKPNNYPRIARSYLLYLVEGGYRIDKVSFCLFVAKKPLWVRSPLRTFLRFAFAYQIVQVKADVPKSSAPLAANGYILAFLADAKSLRGEHSKKSYGTGLNMFFSYIESRSLSYNGHQVNAFVAHLREQALSAYTINLYLSAVRQFTKWIIEHREKLNLHLSVRELDALRDVSSVKRLPTEKGFAKEGLSEAERDHLMGLITHPCHKAIFSLMAYAGLRSVEVVRLQVGDVDLDKSIIQVLGKGRAVKQPVKLFAYTNVALSCYLKTLDEKRANEPFTVRREERLFPGLSTRHIRYLCSIYFKKAGLKRKGVSAHSLRHTAAQILLSKGVDAVFVQRQLRHKDFSTTSLYVQSQIERQFLSALPEDI